MAAWKWLVAGIVSTSTALAQEPPGAAKPPIEDVPPPKSAPSEVSAVTLYQGQALITKAVTVPEGIGVVEVVVTPLPPRTVAGSLYAEGVDDLRILSARYRSRAVRADSRAEVRSKEDQLKSLQDEAEALRGKRQVIERDLEFLTKLEGFTGGSLRELTEKGKLDVEATMSLSKYVMETRASKTAAGVDVDRQIATNKEAIDFTKRQIVELAGGSIRSEVDAVIVVDKSAAPASSIRLSYLVDQASWTPRYRLRAGGPNDPVQLEYLASIEQQTGEDWLNAAVTLSTAQPSLSAMLPDLLPLAVNVVDGDEDDAANAPRPARPGGMGGGMAGMGGMGGSFGGMGPINPPPGGGPMGQGRQAQSLAIRGQAGKAILGDDAKAGSALLNQAAALDQARELLEADDPKAGPAAAPEGLSVTHLLKGRRSVPSRPDAQIVEVVRFPMAPEFFDYAAPILSPRVYRLARLTNTGDTVILPGEASMYVGTDFVGKMHLPQAAVGETFTVGFGIDPQVQIGRRLESKTRSVQGGNQVVSYEFHIVARNFGATPTKLQVWDRLPKADGEAAAVTLVKAKPDLSADPLYLRTGRADNLLRWDLDVPAHTTGEKALRVEYSFKLEYARGKMIDDLRSGVVVEGPIGGMGGGGGFRSRIAEGR